VELPAKEVFLKFLETSGHHHVGVAREHRVSKFPPFGDFVGIVAINE
jgi:hypothetical protein